jgi:hypothetical protein
MVQWTASMFRIQVTLDYIFNLEPDILELVISFKISHGRFLNFTPYNIQKTLIISDPNMTGKLWLCANVHF